MDNLNTITVFVRVAETLSFTAAARRLGISASGASKAVSRLENETGVRLINRTTRKVGLTDDGRMFFLRCRQILADIAEAEIALTQASTVPREDCAFSCRKVLVVASSSLRSVNSLRNTRNWP